MFGTGWCKVAALAGEMHSCLPDDEGQGERRAQLPFPAWALEMADSHRVLLLPSAA